jgi:type IV pilus assembly protein PilY1
VSSSYQSIPFAGGATGVLAADFSLDGRPDLIVTTDNWNYNSGNGGNAYYYVNDGDSAPFSGGVTSTLTDILDYDVSFIFNYDNDPAGTIDVMVADGNHTSSFYVLANRVVNQFVQCGEAASGVIPLGDLATSEMVVTAARLDPTIALNGNGTVTFYLSNEEPPNWVQATDCGDGTGDLCATFPKSSGRDVRWKAYMCSGNNKTTSPTISGMTAKFQYTEATEHYRGGTTVNDGIAYLGAFRQPGDRGKFYAINAGLSQTYWEAASKLDNNTNDSERRLYTAHRDTGERLDFSTSNASDIGLQATLGAANAAEAADLVAWVRSARFGVGNAGISLSKLGAIETSTPAILTPPGLPTWYLFAPSAQRAKVDQFIAANASRPPLVLFGSRDGIVHALHTRPTDITNSLNGKEAWGYIPPHVAGGLLADYSNSIGTTMINSSYPDGSVTLADVHDADGEMLTLAIIAAGNGGDSIAAFDVTRTIDPSNGTVLGPTPLWSAIPGGSAAGHAFSKVAVARVEIANETRFIAIAGTGMDFADTTPPFEYGRTVVAYDALTGEELWKFQTRCPLTSDISVFETRDDLEPGSPSIDGYIDRAAFADACGYVYKVDPARDLGGGWNVNDGLGSIAADVVDGQQLYALFSTELTDDALGEASPVAGTLGAQIDGDTGRLVLFFGTGGLESHSVAEANAFYAVYADTGEIRAQMAGACQGGRCEKFYGGVVVTRDQVLFTRTVDPQIGSGTCDRGSSTIQAVQLSTLEDGQFVVDFEVDASAATMSSLYGDAGAVYFSTLAGDVVRVGSPRATEAGGDSATGSANDPVEEGEGSGNLDSPMSLLGWRQVY